MLNTNKDRNLAIIEGLKKEGYRDLGWSNDGIEFSSSSEKRIQPIQELDCSLYAKRSTHKVYVDHDAKEILHVDMSD